MRRSVLAFVLALVAFARPGFAAPPSKCDAAKLLAFGKKASQNLQCQAKVVAKGLPLDPACRLKATLDLGKAFTKAAKKPVCAAIGTDPFVYADFLDRYAARFDKNLRPATDPNKCAKKKLTAVAKNLAARLKCESVSAKKDLPVDPECRDKALATFLKAFTKAETKPKPPCLTTGDAAATDKAVREAVACVRAPSVATCPTIASYTISIDADGGTAAGYIPLDAFGTAPTAIGDEQLVNFNVPSFVYNGDTYSRIGIDSNGYVVVGGGDQSDNDCCNPALPGAARPNNVLAPFWTDLDGTGAPGIYLTTLTDGVKTWVVVEWRVNVFGTSSLRTFQLWIGVNGEQDITFAYPSPPPASPGGGSALLVGAENDDGTAGDSLGANVLPTGTLRVNSAGTL